MNSPISAAERVRRSRWAGQVEATANKLHQLLLETPIHMPREPVIDMDLIEGLIRLMESEVHEPVNIGNPAERTIFQLAERIK